MNVAFTRLHCALLSQAVCSIIGQVTDPGQSIVPNATVTAVETNTRA